VGKYYHDVYIDQYGTRFYASTRKDLKRQIPGRINKMYQEFDGKTYHVGYVIGSHWLTKFTADIKPVN